jgi:hypothetical protein
MKLSLKPFHATSFTRDILMVCRVTGQLLRFKFKDRKERSRFPVIWKDANVSFTPPRKLCWIFLKEKGPNAIIAIMKMCNNQITDTIFPFGTPLGMIKWNEVGKIHVNKHWYHLYRFVRWNIRWNSCGWWCLLVFKHGFVTA